MDKWVKDAQQIEKKKRCPDEQPKARGFDSMNY